ncbi:MAG: hypothetical protein B7Z29_15110 [Hyphomicrobium sp. 12-62-95]|nr:MAG: hypothetical protein B7Z29_15110 [Hyphomicrobium sp. 12-62-95]
MSFVIYAIADPRCRKVFYIGHTSRLDLRIEQHLEAGETICGLRVQEIVWIDLLSGRGAALTNNQAFDGYSARAGEKRRLRGELGAGTRMEQLAAIANGRPVREGRRWSRKEDQMMRRLKREGKSDYEIADQLSRSVGAIEARLTQKSV